MPAPVMSDENATSNWTAMYPPDDKPDTEVCEASTLYPVNGEV